MWTSRVPHNESSMASVHMTPAAPEIPKPRLAALHGEGTAMGSVAPGPDVDEVTDIEGIMDTGFAFLARYLGGVDEPGEGMREGIGEAAC